MKIEWTATNFNIICTKISMKSENGNFYIETSDHPNFFYINPKFEQSSSCLFEKNVRSQFE